ncbi:MAG: sodium:solute symporter family protein [Prolixibacteraceae bacterium]|nr:sodium:solute symporter family protein [Prolixibacteraceae bacterium]MBN2774385.1 sodium:solute symporter family protein [Prolixibacteraceae bacterium]
MLNIIIILYFLVIIFIGIYSRFQIKSPSDYYIAGKKGGVLQVTGSLIATILGSSAILGTLELSRENGWAAMWFLGCASIGLIILAPFSKYVRRLGNFTLPELIGRLYGKKAEFISSVIIPLAWLGVIAAQITGAAMILNSIGVSGFTNSAVLAGTVIILYTLLGGQKSILKTDLVQAALILCVFILIFFLTSMRSGIPENTIPAAGVFNDHFTVIDLIILFLTYSATFVVGPDIYSRIFCTKNEKTAIRSVIITAVVLIPVAFILTYIGINTPEDSVGGITGFISYWQHHLPLWISGLLIAALLSAVMSSADTTLLTASMIISNVLFGPLEKDKSFKATKVVVVAIGGLSVIISLFVASVIQSLLIALSFFSGAFIIPVIAGLLRLNTNKKTVIPALLVGGFVALAGKITGLYFHEMAGNLIIIFSFILNGIILFVPIRENR